MKPNNKTFCNFPFSSVWTGGSGLINPCCEAQLHNTKEYQIPNHSINEYWNSKELQGLRNDLINGIQHPACVHCWREETQGMTSKRLQQPITTIKNVDVSNPSIKELSLTLTNLCNLGCRMCHHWASSVIEDENRENHSLYYSDKYRINEDKNWHHDDSHFKELDKQRNWWANKDFLNEIYNLLHNIEYLNISGGEPTLNKTLLKILDYCIDNNLAKNIWLEITTNGQQINPKLLEKLHKFNQTHLLISIDGYKNVYEYIRWKGSWNKLEKNIMYLKENSKKNISVTAVMTSQVLNILNLPELLSWLQENKINWTDINAVTRPNYHNILVLPSHVKSIAGKKWNTFLKTNKLNPKQEMHTINIINSLKTNNQSFEDKWWKYFVRDTMIKDEIRNQNLAKSVPELYNIIKERYKL